MSETDFKVANRDKIISLLNGLTISTAKMTLATQGEEDAGETKILRVMPEANCFYITTLGDLVLERRLLDGELFSLNGMDRGIRILLNGLSLDSEDCPSDVLRVPIPDELEYLQKRESVRIPVADENIEVTLVGVGGGEIGKLVDISYEGCRVSFKPSVLAALPQIGSSVTLSTKLPEWDAVTNIECSFRHAESSVDHVDGGFKFQHLNLRVQNLIDQFILNLQRNACRSKQLANG